MYDHIPLVTGQLRNSLTRWMRKWHYTAPSGARQWTG